MSYSRYTVSNIVYPLQYCFNFKFLWGCLRQCLTLQLKLTWISLCGPTMISNSRWPSLAFQVLGLQAQATTLASVLSSKQCFLPFIQLFCQSHTGICPNNCPAVNMAWRKRVSCSIGWLQNSYVEGPWISDAATSVTRVHIPLQHLFSTELEPRLQEC